MRAKIEVDLKAIYQNTCQVQQWIGPDAQIMAVVKADAYGHGLLSVAQTALAAGARWLGVATVDEGIRLRQASLTAPICLLCPFAPEEAEQVIAYGLTPLCGSTQMLESLSRAAARSPRAAAFPSEMQAVFQPRKMPAIHLDIDTGIGRSGVQPADAVALWQQAVRSGFHVTGIATHFADADNIEFDSELDIETNVETEITPNETQHAASSTSLNQRQEAAFAATLTALAQAGAHFDWVHATNSPATLRHFAPAGNLVRPGLLLYGISPFQTEQGKDNLPFAFSSEFPLIPTLALKATVATVRTLPQGHPISYGATVHLTRPSRVATVLIGYGDGYPRRLSNNGAMLIRGQRVPILGRVCMDQTVVDVTEVPEVVAGEEAVCIGTQGKERISVEELARRTETTPHEITTCLTARLPRVYLPAI